MQSEMLSLEPLPQNVYFMLDERERLLQGIGDCVAYWLQWVTKERAVEGLETDGNTHVILDGDNAPPHWPHVAQLTRWLQIIRSPALELQKRLDRPGVEL